MFSLRTEHIIDKICTKYSIKENFLDMEYLLNELLSLKGEKISTYNTVSSDTIDNILSDIIKEVTLYEKELIENNENYGNKQELLKVKEDLNILKKIHLQ